MQKPLTMGARAKKLQPKDLHSRHNLTNLIRQVGQELVETGMLREPLHQSCCLKSAEIPLHTSSRIAFNGAVFVDT